MVAIAEVLSQRKPVFAQNYSLFFLCSSACVIEKFQNADFQLASKHHIC
jgi:hypothetical protein